MLVYSLSNNLRCIANEEFGTSILTLICKKQIYTKNEIADQFYRIFTNGEKKHQQHPTILLVYDISVKFITYFSNSTFALF